MSNRLLKRQQDEQHLDKRTKEIFGRRSLFSARTAWSRRFRTLFDSENSGVISGALSDARSVRQNLHGSHCVNAMAVHVGNQAFLCSNAACVQQEFIANDGAVGLRCLGQLDGRSK